MQKSATPASVALRLNNLEQKFDNFEVSEPGEGDRALVDKLARMTVVGSETSVISGDWSKNAYYFESSGGGSLIASLYGIYALGSLNYVSVSGTYPFYTQVFDRHQGQFGSNYDKKSLTGSVFGDRYEAEDIKAFVHEFVRRSPSPQDSLAETIFGDRDALAWLRTHGIWTFGSQTNLVGHIFGEDPAEYTADINIVAGDNTHSKTSLLGLMKGLKNRCDLLLEELSDAKSDISYLEARVLSLESKVDW